MQNTLCRSFILIQHKKVTFSAYSITINTFTGRKILEINPKHPIILQLEEAVKADPSSQNAKSVADILYETALLTSGFNLSSPSQYGDRVYKMLG